MDDIGFELNITWATVFVLVDLILRVVAVIVVPRNRRPQTAMAWLLAIFALPVPGFLLFLLLGNRNLSKRRREKQREINEYIINTTDGIDRVSSDPPWPAYLAPIVELNRNLGAMPMVGGNDAKLYPHYEASLEAMTNSISDAKKYVHIEFYILALDSTTEPFFDALEEARAARRRGAGAARPHRLRALGGLQEDEEAPHEDRRALGADAAGAAAQGQVAAPRPAQPPQALVIDGLIAFTGSQNFIDSSYNLKKNIKRGLHWKDLMARFEGPIVSGINALFVTDWYSETDELLTRETEDIGHVEHADPMDAQVVPSGPGFEGENNLRLFNALIYAATKKVIITSPYFVPDDSMLYAITTAAQSGLDVQLFASEIGDQFMVFHAQRSYYEELLRAGVRIFLYPAPTILHAKHFTIDDEVSVIGSSNMDMRSFSLDYEISIMVRGHGFVEELREVEEEYRAVCRELTLEEWLKRPRRVKVLDNTMRLTAALQ